MDEGKVSVIIPIYNAALYLQECLYSVLNQSYTNIEVILIDDGSTDESLEICKDFQRQDARVVVLSQTNQGVSCARNVGLSVASGNYISFVDSDDWIEPEIYEILIKEMVLNNCDCAMFEYYIEYQDRTITHIHSETAEVLSNSSAIKNTITPVNRFACSKIFSKKLIHNLKFDTNIRVGEDTLFSCEALKHASKVYFSNKPLYHYRQNQHSATGNGYNLNYMTAVSAYTQIAELFQKEKELYQCAIIERAVFLINNIVGLYRHYPKQFLNIRKSYIKELRCDAGKILFWRQVTCSNRIKIIACAVFPNIFSEIRKYV